MDYSGMSAKQLAETVVAYEGKAKDLEAKSALAQSELIGFQKKVLAGETVGASALRSAREKVVDFQSLTEACLDVQEECRRLMLDRLDVERKARLDQLEREIAENREQFGPAQEAFIKDMAAAAASRIALYGQDGRVRQEGPTFYSYPNNETRALYSSELDRILAERGVEKPSIKDRFYMLDTEKSFLLTKVFGSRDVEALITKAREKDGAGGGETASPPVEPGE